MPRPGSNRTNDSRVPPGQDVHWGRQARRYGELFLDPLSPGVQNPLWNAIERIPSSAVVADLGCGAGPLLPALASRFRKVYAVDFSSVMIATRKGRELELYKY